MKNKIAAGILPFRKDKDGKIEVLLGKPGGPFWKKKGDTNWTYFKGRSETGESLYETAIREFEEETGWKFPNVENLDMINLGWSSTKTKQIICFAVEMDIDTSKLKSNKFEMEWPPKSKTIKTFPEIEDYRWFKISKASRIIMDSQAIFILRLSNRYKGTIDSE